MGDTVTLQFLQFVPGAMEQNRSDLFCSRVAGKFNLLHATIYFLLEEKNDHGTHGNSFKMRMQWSNVALHAHEKRFSDSLA